METISINKEQLVQILKENKEKHVASYLEAIENYKDAVKVYFPKFCQDALDNPEKLPRYDPPLIPLSYEKDYNNAIEMLSYEVNDSVTLSAKEFRQLVKNQWSWSQDFESTFSKNKSYL